MFPVGKKGMLAGVGVRMMTGLPLIFFPLLKINKINLCCYLHRWVFLEGERVNKNGKHDFSQTFLQRR